MSKNMQELKEVIAKAYAEANEETKDEKDKKRLRKPPTKQERTEYKQKQIKDELKMNYIMLGGLILFLIVLIRELIKVW